MVAPAEPVKGARAAASSPARRRTRSSTGRSALLQHEKEKHVEHGEERLQKQGSRKRAAAIAAALKLDEAATDAGQGCAAGVAGVAACDGHAQPAAEGEPDEEDARPTKRGRKAGKAKQDGPMREMEDGLRKEGHENVAGVDEAGRGPLAGPVVVAACIVPPGVQLEGLHDSKQMSEEQREQVYGAIVADPRIKWTVTVVDHEDIDRLNILQATLFGMRRSLEKLGGSCPQPHTTPSGQAADATGVTLGHAGQSRGAAAEVAGAAAASRGSRQGRGDATCSPQQPTSKSEEGVEGVEGVEGGGARTGRTEEQARCEEIVAMLPQSGGGTCEVHYALVDGNRLPKELPCPADAVVKGDGRCVCIAAASVLAKVTRDRIMQCYHELYPQYAFDQNKAYGVPAHIEAIRKHGPCPIHRRSFEPVKSMTGWSRPSLAGGPKAKAGTAKGVGAKGGASGKRGTKRQK